VSEASRIRCMHEDGRREKMSTEQRERRGKSYFPHLLSLQIEEINKIISGK